MNREISALGPLPSFKGILAVPTLQSAQNGLGCVEISANQGVAAGLSRILTFEIGFSDSRGGAISALAVFYGLLTHISAPEKSVVLSRYPRIKGSILQRPAGRACCTDQDAHIRNQHLRLERRSDFGCCLHSGHSGNAVWKLELSPRKKMSRLCQDILELASR